MLGTLCTLITALTCKEADLLQLRPRVGFISLCVSLDSVWSCCFQVWVVWRWWHRSLLLWPWGKERQSPWTVTWGLLLASTANWYKQIPGGVPQHVVRFHHGWSSPSYGSGFSSPKFTSTHQSTTDYRLIINNVEEGDSAVYYCQTWDGSASEHVSQWFTLWQKPPHLTLLLFLLLTHVDRLWSHQVMLSVHRSWNLWLYIYII